MIGRELEELEKLIKENRIGKTYIRFPWGVISKAEDIRMKWLLFIKNYDLRTNIAYHIMHLQFNAWIMSRFNIVLTVREMIIKDSISTMGNLVDAIAIHTAKKITNVPPKPEWLDELIEVAERIIENKEERNALISRLKSGYDGTPGFNRALKILVENDIIDSNLRKRLLKIWSIRNKVHLLNLKEKEWQKYNDILYGECRGTFIEFIKALQKARKEGKI